MSTGKYLSLEEAQKEGALDRFAKEHPSKGNEREFDRLLGRMASGQKQPASPREEDSAKRK
jgi:hypothetical protein